MAAFLNVCRFNPTLGGTTDWTYSSIVTGYQSPTSAGVVNSRLYKYRAESTDLSQWEIGEGAYDTGTGVLARTTVLYNSSGTGTASGQSGAGSKINFSTVPNVAIVAIKEDLVHLDESNTFTSQNTFASQIEALSGVRVTGATGEKLTIKGNANRFYLNADSNVPIQILNSAGTASGYRVYTTDTQVALYSSGVARFNLTGSFIALTPNGTDTRLQISNTSLQLHYDNIVLAPVANFPGITWKHVDALGGLDKPYGNIGVATSDSNKFRISSGPTAANIPANNSLILASYNGTSEIDRITIPGGAATVNIQVSNANLLSTGSVWAYSGTAIPAGGTTGSGFKLSSTANLGIFFGSGAPTLSAAKGSKYMRTDGSTTNNREYINTDGGTTWTAVITAA